MNMAKGLQKGAKRAIKGIVLLCYRILAHILPVDSGTIVFMSSLGRSYTGNPRAVCEKMAELGMTEKFRCYYILDEPGRFAGKLPKGVRTLKNARFRYYMVMARAGVWVSDTRFRNYMVKRKKTLYIQTWHGTPLKKLGLDLTQLHMAGEETLAQYKEAFKKNAATWDYLISQNPFSSEVFRRAFAFSGKLLEIGYPRNDRIVKWEKMGITDSGTCTKNQQAGNGSSTRQSPPQEAIPGKEEAALRRLASALQKKLAIPEGKKVMLYAPTWRDDAFYNEKDYKFTTALDFGKMQQAFAKEYVLVVKYHYMVREKEPRNEYPGFVITVGEDVDIAELYMLADLLITDYSSAMFDYSLLKRPMYFFAYDLENYRDTLRGFYFDFEAEAPGPVVTTTEALVAAILGGMSPDAVQRYARFAEKYNPYDDGHASEKVLEIIKRHKEGKEKTQHE